MANKKTGKVILKKEYVSKRKLTTTYIVMVVLENLKRQEIIELLGYNEAFKIAENVSKVTDKTIEVYSYDECKSVCFFEKGENKGIIEELL